MSKLRYKSMAIAVVVGVGAFIGAQRLELIPGPWTRERQVMAYVGTSAQQSAAASASVIADPNDYMAYYRRGTLHFQQRRYQEALADLNTAVKLSPTPLSLEALGARIHDSRQRDTHTLGMVVLIHTTRSEILQRLNKPDEALADLDRALAFNGGKTDIMHSRGLLRTVTGQYDGAIADFDTLLERRSNSEWLLSRGVAKYLKTDWAGAIADFQILAQRPSNDAALIWLAKTYLRASLPMPPDLFAEMKERSGAWYVIEAYMSDHSPAQFVSGVRAGAAYADRHNREQSCETALFIGEWLVIRKKSQGARAFFTEAATNCPSMSIERAIAAAELKRLPQ